MGERLSIVAERIGRSLSLAQKVDLFLLLGPSHRGEETLEALARQLAPDRIHVYHRFHEDGEALDDAAAGTTDPNPFVLAWGLEYVPEDELTDVLVGLNHRRDRLRLWPATHMVWIPCELLDVFSRRCQDLVEWRRLLLEVDETPPIPADVMAWRTLGLELQRRSARRAIQLRGALEGLTVPEPDEDLELRLEGGLPTTLEAWTRDPGLRALVGHTTLGKTAQVRRLARRAARRALVDPREPLVLLGPAEHLPLDQPLGIALQRWIKFEYIDLDRFLATWAAEGRLRLALDDVDGWSADRQQALWRWCEAACEQNPRLGVLVIGRAGLSLPPAWDIAAPLPWGESAVLRLLRARGLDEQTLSALVERRLEITSPYLAEIIAAIYLAEGRLPDDTLTLLDRVLAIPTDPSLDAAAMAALSASVWDLPLAGLRPASVEALRGLGAEPRGDILHFTWHLPLSYLAARHLLRQGIEAVRSAGREYSGEPFWDDLARLLASRVRLVAGPWGTGLKQRPTISADRFGGIAPHRPVQAGPSARAAAPAGAPGALLSWVQHPPRDRMTPTARRQLQLTIRDLHDRLQADLRASAERHWRWTRDWPKHPNAHTLALWKKKWGASEAGLVARERVEAWISETARAEGVSERDRPALRERLIVGWVREAAYTLLHRLVILCILEAVGLRRGRVVSGGWESTIYKDLRQLAPALIRDDTEGMGFLIEALVDELSLDLPGVYGDVGLTRLIPVPPATLRHLLDALDDPALRSCWTDDTALGWIYQYWNDPDREALDKKLAKGGKLANDEIASKTQLFTERYLVEWLLQNSLGPLWLRMCYNQGWTPEAVSSGALARLDQKRAAWRADLAAGRISAEVELSTDDEQEERWRYYVAQDLPAGAAEAPPRTLSELRLLDPACGSGHFLVVAFDLLFALYQEEARHRGLEGQPGWTDAEIARAILEQNLHGLDLDPRAVQIAAAALWLKARRAAPDVEIGRLNLVASNLGLGALPPDDPALVALRDELSTLGVAPKLADALVARLGDADHLGALLQVDAALEEALDEQSSPEEARQTGLFAQRRAARRQGFEAALERFLVQHSAGEDLGLRLRGEQLAKGARFVRLLRRGGYHLVVGNPPYQGLQKLGDKRTKAYIERHYPEGKHDLYAAFLLRGLELAGPGGLSAMITMRGWMFIQQFAELRATLLKQHTLVGLGDVDRGAFEEIGGAVVASVMSVFCNVIAPEAQSYAVRATPAEDMGGVGVTSRKRAGLLARTWLYRFQCKMLSGISGQPIVYWWSDEDRISYAAAPKLEERYRSRKGITTGQNVRFIRKSWECNSANSIARRFPCSASWDGANWVPVVMGGAGDEWFDRSDERITWKMAGAELAHFTGSRFGRGADGYFHQGIAISVIGVSFYARCHRYASIISDAGCSVYPNAPNEIPGLICSMQRTDARRYVQDLNPTVNFKLTDVDRLPLFPVASADEIVATLDRVFTEHESHRETSVEFRAPGPSAWDSAQRWAQRAVDRPAGAPLEPFEPEYLDVEISARALSYALGVALGRFAPDGTGALDPASADHSTALPRGILFLVPDDLPEEMGDLGHPAAAPLRAAWARHRADFPPGQSLGAWLRERFFADVHRPMYESRPIHWPLSSERRSFVAFVQLHRMDADTLPALLADRVRPALQRLDGQRLDLHRDRLGADRARARDAERRLERVQRLHDELSAFAAQLQGCMEKGPPPANDKAPRRERDAPWAPWLDDGVRVQAGSLWPLLEPQWKDPRRFWEELCADDDKNDDWSRTAARYFPARVARRCVDDPSLAVAHGRFWELHPELAYLWELRLSRDLGPDFRVDEPGSAERRAAWLAENPDLAKKIEEKARRGRRETEDQADGAQEESE